MESFKKVLLIFIAIILIKPVIFSQNELMLGNKKIKVPGIEICNYTVNKNSHINKHFLDIKNGILLYTVIEYSQGVPVHLEVTECKMEDLDMSSCSLGASDQKSSYTPGAIYIIYLYTLRDQVSISTTVYDSTDNPANIQKTAIGRIHFRDYQVAENYYNAYFK